VGEEHHRLRKSLLPLFTRKALGMYLTVQDKLIRESIAEWLKVGHIETEIRSPIRDMNVWTSQKVFCGPYIRSLAERDEFNRNYQCMVDGFLSFLINLPGTGLWKAIRARGVLIDTLMRYCRESKARMSTGEEPACLLDF
jgi:cytochrome P450